MNIPEYSGAGIYKIDFGFAAYVGSAIDVRARIKQHATAAKRGREPRALQAAFDACPSPHVDILEKIGDNELAIKIYDRERYWVQEEATGGLNTTAVPNPQPEFGIQHAENQIREYKRRIKMQQEYIKKAKGKYLVPISQKRRLLHGNRQEEAGDE